MSHYFQDKTSVLQVLSAVRKMEPTEIVEWCLKVIWYFLILLGIGGNLALFKEYLYQKNQKLLFNFLILWLAVFDFLYLICLASNIIILAILESMARDDLYGTTGKGLKITYRVMIYLEKIGFSASVLTTIILAIERFLVCRKVNTNKCNFKWIWVSIGDMFFMFFIICV